MKNTIYECSVCGKKFSKPHTMQQDGQAYESCPVCHSSMYTEYLPPTKKELLQYIHLKRELDDLSERLSKTPIKNPEYSELYEIIENGKMRCLALLIKTEKFIYSIDDSLLRQVFRLKYVKGLTWKQVAAQTGGYASCDCLRIMHDRYLASLSKHI